MNWKTKLVGLSILFALLLTHPFQSVAQEEERSIYPKHIIVCLEAKDQMGDEWHHAELMSVTEVGEADCAISLMFANEKDIEKFEDLRKKKGLNPNFVTYKNKKIKIDKTIGKIGLY